MDAKNFYFFTGENTYTLDRELLRWKENFRSKHGAENLLVLKGKECSVSDILDAVATMPFIAEKRLVVIEGVPKMDKEECASVVDNIHPQTVLVIADAKPDKRLTVVKEIEKVADTKKFPVLLTPALVQWVQTRAKECGSSITSETAKVLLSIVGNDQWTLDSELQKLAAFASGSIEVADVEELAVPSGMQVIWKFTDLIGSKKPEEAMAFLKNRLERGEDAYGLWTILLNMIKNLALVVSALHAGVRDDRSIAGSTGIHPFALRGLMPLARSMTPEKISALVAWAAEADIQLKSGGYRSIAEHPEEVIALTERAILLCN